MTDKERIQELNKHLDRGVALVDAMTLEIDSLRQENERFRKALEDIRNIKQPDGAYISRLDVANTVAKQALDNSY